ncbi:MAG: hypothetical protein WCX28_14045 [Bacteriovoracaceae bacterium]
MDNHILHTEYLRKGTAGYGIISRFYSRYADIFSQTNVTDINDVVHDVFLSLSKTDISDVRNSEHYIMRAIKLQCWSLLDKAIKQKGIIVKTETIGNDHTFEHADTYSRQVTDQKNQFAELEGDELLVQINLFKSQLNPDEIRLLNFLIDEEERPEIARLMKLKLNTLDTKIRRIRLKLADYLKNRGYLYKGMEKFT